MMNCGRLPTIERIRIGSLDYAAPCGPLAQLVEQGTLNPKVEGSNPSRPMFKSAALIRVMAAALVLAGAASADVTVGVGQRKRNSRLANETDHER